MSGEFAAFVTQRDSGEFEAFVTQSVSVTTEDPLLRTFRPQR
jgi:hypothetical protein